MSATTTATPAAATTAASAPIHFDFPAVHGEVFLHAFCVLDADRVTVRTTMPEDFSYKQVRSKFHTNTRLFGDSEAIPKGRSIRYRGQCRGGTYLMPSHEYYRGGTGGASPPPPSSSPGGEENVGADGDGTESGYDTRGFSYDGTTFGLDIVPTAAAAADPDPVVTVCAFVPDPSLWGQLTGGWDTALREAGFRQARFEDSSEMVWEVHCRDVSASESAKARERAAKEQAVAAEKAAAAEALGAKLAAAAEALAAKKAAVEDAIEVKKAAHAEAAAAKEAVAAGATPANKSALKIAEAAVRKAEKMHESAASEAKAAEEAAAAAAAAAATGTKPKSRPQRNWLRGKKKPPPTGEQQIHTHTADQRPQRSFLF